MIVRASAASVGTPKNAPSIKIDNTTDEFATLLRIEYAGELDGEQLMELTRSLSNLNTNVTRASLSKDGDRTNCLFYVTERDTSDKILKSERIEEIRCTTAYALSESDDNIKVDFHISIRITSIRAVPSISDPFSCYRPRLSPFAHSEPQP